MEVTAVVNGNEQVDSVTVQDPQVEILLAKTSMKFSIHTVKPSTGEVKRDEPSTQAIKIWVLRTDGSRVLFRDVDLVLIPHEGTAGHVHRGGKPAGSLDLTHVNTGPSGEAIVHYTAPKVSGDVTIRGTSIGAVSDTAVIAIGLFTLAELVPGVNYSLNGDLAGRHVQNHFATASHIVKLGQLADAFFKTFKSGPTFNDSSLPLGGVYDLNLDWDQPHETHSEGLATDFQTNGVNSNRRKFVFDMWEGELKGIVGDETGTSQPHYHLASK